MKVPAFHFGGSGHGLDKVPSQHCDGSGTCLIKAVLQHFMGWLRNSQKTSGRVAGVPTLLEYKSTASH